MAAPLYRKAPLAFLSLQQTRRGKAPEAYTNEERRKAYDRVKPVVLDNGRPQRWHKDQKP